MVQSASGQSSAFSAARQPATLPLPALPAMRRKLPVDPLTAAGIALCHVISTMLCALLAVLFGLIHIRGIVKEKRILPILKAAGLCVLLLAFQYVPFLTYASEGIGAADLAWHLIYNTIEPAQLLTLGRGTIAEPKNLRLLSFSAGLDLWLIIGAGLALVAILRGRRRDENERKALTFIAGGVFFAVASTDFFPWSYVALIDHGLMDYMQFTWRLLMLAVVFNILCEGTVYGNSIARKPWHDTIGIGIGALSNLGLCAAFVPRFGMTGAAFALAASNGLAFLYRSVTGQMYYRTIPSFAKTISGFLLAFAVTAIGTLLWQHFFIKFALVGVILFIYCTLYRAQLARLWSMGLGILRGIFHRK